MLTPEDVLNTTFTQTQFREGYDERQVDELLDDVVASMRHLDDPAQQRPKRLLSSADVGRVRFTPTRMRRGYDMAEVDALLERVAEALAEREGRAPATPSRGTAGPEASPAVAGRGGFGAGLLRLLRGDPRS